MSLPITARCLLSPLLHSPLPTYPSPSNLKFLRPFSTSLPKSIPVTLASDSYPPPLPSSSSSSTAGIEGNKGPLIILHGLYGSKQNWRSLSKTLAKNLNREVIAVVSSFPSFLPSPPPPFFPSFTNVAYTCYCGEKSIGSKESWNESTFKWYKLFRIIRRCK